MKSKTLVAAALGATAMIISLTACSGGTAGGGSTGGGEAASSGTIAFLMPDLASTRYEQQDAPLFKEKVAELCPDCTVNYQNAAGDPSTQQEQAEAAIADGAQVIVLDAVDTKAAAAIVQNAQSQGIKVVTYDRPIVDIAADFYVSFDNEAIGYAIAESVLTQLDADGATGGVLQVNGSPTDNAAGLIRDGVDKAIQENGRELLAAYDTPAWDPQKAQDWVSGQIAEFSNQIVGVIAANDGTAGGSIAALTADGVTPLPLVSGNDAEVAAIQRIVSGSQFNTISKPIATVAGAAADVAVQLLNGETPTADTTLFDTPAQLFEPTVVTKENVKEVIFDGGIYTADQICTAEYAAACTELGIQ
ncbi:substrate-binding domain-containing protein [Microbacterium sp. P01]|uniref:substrate-binding domain-containing protein n=1 Tax=unclassified Microbacterium TaxID=2609290 RepID=UPI003670DDF1